MQDMPTCLLTYEEFTDERDIGVLLNNTFGFYLVNIHVFDEKYNDVF